MQENTKRRSRVRFNELHQLFNCLCNATSRSGEGACLNHGVGECVKQWETTEVETLRHQQSTFPRKSPETHLHLTSSRKSSEVWRRQSWQIDQEPVWNSRCFHIWQLDYVNLICGELGGFRRGKHSAALFHNPNQDVRMAVHGDDSVCLSDDDGLKHIGGLLKSKCTAKDMGTLGCEDSNVKSFLLLNRVFRVGVDQTGHETHFTHHQ